MTIPVTIPTKRKAPAHHSGGPHTMTNRTQYNRLTPPRKPVALPVCWRLPARRGAK